MIGLAVLLAIFSILMSFLAFAMMDDDLNAGFGVMFLVFAIFISAAAIFVSHAAALDQWQEWYACTNNETAIKVEDCDEYYKLPGRE